MCLAGQIVFMAYCDHHYFSRAAPLRLSSIRLISSRSEAASGFLLRLMVDGIFGGTAHVYLPFKKQTVQPQATVGPTTGCSRVNVGRGFCEHTLKVLDLYFGLSLDKGRGKNGELRSAGECRSAFRPCELDIAAHAVGEDIPRLATAYPL